MAYQKKLIWIWVVIAVVIGAVLYVLMPLLFLQKKSDDLTSTSVVQNSAQTAKKQEQSPWIGEYVYTESSPPDETWIYDVTVYQAGNDLRAKLAIDGFQTLVRINGTIKPSDKGFDVLFDSYGSDMGIGSYERGDLLFSLERSLDPQKSNEYVVYWGGLQSMLNKNQDGGIFEKQ